MRENQEENEDMDIEMTHLNLQSFHCFHVRFDSDVEESPSILVIPAKKSLCNHTCLFIRTEQSKMEVVMVVKGRRKRVFFF